MTLPQLRLVDADHPPRPWTWDGARRLLYRGLTVAACTCALLASWEARLAREEVVEVRREMEERRQRMEDHERKLERLRRLDLIERGRQLAEKR